MKELLRNWLLQNKGFNKLAIKKALAFCFFFYSMFDIKGQTFLNLVPNGSFETYSTCPGSSTEIRYAYPWTAPYNNSADYYNSCCTTGFYNVPFYGGLSSYYQLNAKEGQAYAAIYFFQPNYREYIQVKLTDTLKNNTCYYVEFYASNMQQAKYKTNNIGASLISTSYPDNGSSGALINIPTHITNYGNPVLNDTAHWCKISGLYNANGTEKYLIMGNFNTDLSTDTVNLYPPNTYPYSLSPFAYVFIDAVSVYSINPTGNLPWSYRDTTVISGDSIYIGNSIGGIFNPSWYTYTGGFITNNSGIYVKPTSDTKYVIEYSVCGTIRKDTIEVKVNSGIGINESKLIKESCEIYPQPANNCVMIKLNYTLNYLFNKYCIYNNFGQLIQEGKMEFKNNEAKLNTEEFSNGVYFISISNQNHETITKKLVIAK